MENGLMKFKKFTSYKYYDAWVSNEVKGFKVYIFKLPYHHCDYFHFLIIHDGKVIYHSLSLGIYFHMFNHCRNYAESLIKRKINKQK